MKKEVHVDVVFTRIALESPAISGLLEDLGYGPWRAANAKHEKSKSRKARRDSKKRGDA